MKKVTGKVISLFASVIFTFNFTGMPGIIKAEGNTYPSDYTPGTKNANLIVQESGYTTAQSFARNAGRNGSGTEVDVNSTEPWTLQVLNVINNTNIQAGGNLGFYGIVYKQVSFAADTSYVFSLKAKKTAGDTVKLGMAITNETSGGVAYSKEYATDGALLTSDYQTVGSTIKTPSGADFSSKSVLVAGFPAGVSNNSVVNIDLSAEGNVYLAAEQAYDIKTTKVSGNSELVAGDSASFAAEVVNQIGSSGYLDQNFTWYALNTERTETVSGITVTPSADTKTAAISIGSAVAAGQYDIVAYSNNYSMAKGYRITVSAGLGYRDYVPGTKNANLMNIDSTAARTFANGAGRNSTDVTTELGGTWSAEAVCYTPARLTAINNITAGGILGFKGFVFKNASFDANKSYIFSVKARKTTSDIVKLGTALTNETNGGAAYSTEYGTDGALLTADYQTINYTIKTPAETNYSSTHNISTGFAAGTAAGAVAEIDTSEPDNVYFGEEQAYDMTLTANSDTVIVNKNTIGFSAEVINQLNYRGNLSQNIEWFALNRDKTAYVNAITFTQGASSGNVTASWSDSLEDGEYVIVARSSDYGIVKTQKIIITGDYLEDKTTATMSPNIVPDTTAAGGFTYMCINNNATLDYAFNYGNEVDWKVKSGNDNFVPDAWPGFSGFELGDRNGSWPFEPEGGKSYVISMKVKNTSTNGVTPYFGASMNNTWDKNNAVYTNEYGATGMAVDSTTWKDFKATLTLPQNYDPGQAYGKKVFFGMNQTMASGVGFGVDVSTKDSVYVAEESPNKVALSCDTVSALTAGTTINITASVVNQIGIKGTLLQDLDIYCVNENGTETVKGMTITGTNGGAVLTVDSVPGSDKIKIVAVSKKYGLISSVSPMASAQTEKRTFYVSASGDDSGSGSEHRPLATLAGARNKIRNLKSQGITAPVDVIFNSGTYCFDNTTSFTADDSGTEGNVITYKGADGADVWFTGAHSIDFSAAHTVTDTTMLSRLKENVRDKVVEIDLSKQNFPYTMSDENTRATITQLYDTYEHPELYLNGEEQTLAQWPNGDSEYANFTYDGSGTSASNNKIVYSGDEPSSWTAASANDWWIGGYLNYDYVYTRFPGVSVDSANRKLTVGINTNFSSLSITDPSATTDTATSKRWKAFNLPEEIDTPTEWYLDKNTMKLYYYMPHTTSGSTLEISLLKDDMISLVGTNYIGFENINFEKTRGNAVTTTNVKNISVKNCKFENIGVDAFSAKGTVTAASDASYWQVQFLNAAYNCEVSDCKFNNVGGHAIVVDGGNVDTLTSSNNIIKNNLLYKCSQKIRGYEAILVKGCGNTIENNNISRCPFQAIRSYGNDHIIRYNEIYDVIRDTDDVGAIYCGRNTIQRGTKISYNYIHDLQGTYTASFGHKTAIYWDDMQTGISADHNIIKNAKINVYTNGVDNSFTYNTSVDITKTNLDIRNGGAASNANTETTAFSGTIENKTLYYSKYANLQKIVESSDRTDRTLAQYNIIKGNLCVNGPGSNGIGTYTAKPIKGGFWNLSWVTAGNVADNTDAGDASYFVDAANQDYRVLKSSAVGSSGVPNEDFDIDLIGVQTKNTFADEAPILVSPYSGENTAEETIRFMWNDVPGANSYTIKVAADADFTNIVATKDVYYNFAEIPSLAVNGTKYYWKVTAHNTSREFAADWDSAVSSFVNGEKISASFAVAADNTVTISITNNYYSSGKSADIYFVEYDSNNEHVSLRKWTRTLAYQTADTFVGETISISDPIKTKTTGLFIWDTDQMPLRENIKKIYTTK